MARPERNVLCPRYSGCLSLAARNDAKSLPCASCRHKKERIPPEALLQDLPGVMLLLMAVLSMEDRRVRALWEEHRREIVEANLDL